MPRDTGPYPPCPTDWRGRPLPRWPQPGGLGSANPYGYPATGPAYGTGGYGGLSQTPTPPSHRRDLPAFGRGVLRWALRLMKVVLVLDLLAESYFVGLNWFDPPLTAFMLEAKLFGNGKDVLHDHVDLRYVSQDMIASTLAHEDAQLPRRFTGIDWDQFQARAQHYEEGDPTDPYGSPIPEQLAKNLLLFPARSPARKAMDAVLAEQLVHSMPKTRVLELYLNLAQFGPGLYGVCDASWYYFNTSPDHLNWDQAAQLMGLLPGPEHARRAANGGIDVSTKNPDTYYTLKKIRGARQAVRTELDRSSGKDHLGLARSTVTGSAWRRSAWWSRCAARRARPRSRGG